MPKGAASSVSCKPPWRRCPRGGGSDFPDGVCCFVGKKVGVLIDALLELLIPETPSFVHGDGAIQGLQEAIVLLG